MLRTRSIPLRRVKSPIGPLPMPRAAASVGLPFYRQCRARVTPGYPTMEITMRSSVLLIAQLVALSFLVGGTAMAQTMPAASTPTKLSKAALRKQDKEECAKQVDQQNIAKRNQ